MSYIDKKLQRLNQWKNSLTKLLIIYLAIVIVSGCGTKRIDLSEQNKTNIPNFSINAKVAMPDSPGFMGSGQATGAMFGAVGAIAGAIAEKDEPDKIKKYLNNQGINIGTIVRSEFERQLLNNQRFSEKLKEDARSQFKLEIINYGLIVRPFSSEYRPSLKVSAKLIDETGTVVWEQSDWIANLGDNDKIPSYVYDDYFKSPEAFKSSFTIAAKEVVQLLIEEMD